MNDDFEKRLQRQPLRPVPGQWRSEILAAAQTVAPSRHPSPATRYTLLSGFGFRILSLFWPSPYAWGGLAAAWVLILIVNLSSGDRPAVMAQTSTPLSPQLMAAVREQQRMLAELIGQPESPPVADRPKLHSLQPRSDRHARVPAV